MILRQSMRGFNRGKKIMPEAIALMAYVGYSVCLILDQDGIGWCLPGYALRKCGRESCGNVNGRTGQGGCGQLRNVSERSPQCVAREQIESAVGRSSILWSHRYSDFKFDEICRAIKLKELFQTRSKPSANNLEFIPAKTRCYFVLNFSYAHDV